MHYTVQNGDTIAKVANLLDCTWKELKAANPKAVGRSRQNGNWFLREGMTVAVGGGSRFANELDVAKQQRDRVAATGAEIHHVVQPGETIWQLATQTYGVDPDALQQFNGVDDPRRLQIGQVLRIPEHLPTFQPPPPSEAVAKMDDTDATTGGVSAAASVSDTAGGDGAANSETAGGIATSASDAAKTSWQAARATAEYVVGKAIEVVASWYGQYHHGRAMANGEPFNMFAATIAHKYLPLGAKVRLENPATGQRVIATVTDRGPYIEGRDVDLSYGVAKRLSLEKQGVGSLLMTVL